MIFLQSEGQTVSTIKTWMTPCTATYSRIKNVCAHSRHSCSVFWYHWFVLFGSRRTCMPPICRDGSPFGFGPKDEEGSVLERARVTVSFPPIGHGAQRSRSVVVFCPTPRKKRVFALINALLGTTPFAMCCCLCFRLMFGLC